MDKGRKTCSFFQTIKKAPEIRGFFDAKRFACYLFLRQKSKARARSPKTAGSGSVWSQTTTFLM